MLRQTHQSRLFTTKRLEEIFPEILCVKDENLNIRDAKDVLINKVWFDKKKYRTIRDAAKALGISERTLHREAGILNLPPRKKKMYLKFK